MPFTCVFHEATGWHCPGCGMTRAAFATLHGQFFEAFRQNPLGMVLLPAALVALVPEVARWTKGLPPKQVVRIGRRGTVGLVLAVIAFGVLRNLPWVPFCWLAPH